jgi:hypothetical protein
MASTFLGDERWRDYLPTEEPSEAPAPPPDTGAHPFRCLVDRIGIKSWSTWFKPLQLEREGDLQIILAPSRFHADRIRADFEQLLRELLGEIEVRP